MRLTIRSYIDEIDKSVEEIYEAGILDHVINRLLPVVTSLRASIAGSRDNEYDSVDIQNFDIEELFALSQKNERQLRFHKVKSPGRQRPSIYSSKNICSIYIALYTQSTFLFNICRYPCKDEKQILTERLNNAEDELVTTAVHVSILNTLKTFFVKLP